MPNSILIVDDEPATRSTLKQIFTAKGLAVRSADNGFEALSLIRDHQPDVLLSDLNMPGMSGFELLGVVRRLYRSIFVIATSGLFTGGDVPTGLPADAFYPKASKIDSLFDAIAASTQSSSLAARTPANAVWVAPVASLKTGESCCILSCPHCLRAFPRLLASARTPDPAIWMHETTCSQCRERVHYVVVPFEEAK